jgi:hypothetical protein
MDQIVNNYLSKNKLDDGTNKINNTNKVLEDSKTYTTMEHTWDELTVTSMVWMVQNFGVVT